MQELGIPPAWSQPVRPTEAVHSLRSRLDSFGSSHYWPLPDIGWFLGDRGGLKAGAMAAFVVGFWLLDVANNMTQGPCRPLFAVLTGIQKMRERDWMYLNGVLNLAIVIPQFVVSLGSGPQDQLCGGGNSPALAVASVAAFTSGLIAILAIPRSGLIS